MTTLQDYKCPPHKAMLLLPAPSATAQPPGRSSGSPDISPAATAKAAEKQATKKAQQAEKQCGL